MCAVSSSFNEVYISVQNIWCELFIYCLEWIFFHVRFGMFLDITAAYKVPGTSLSPDGWNGRLLLKEASFKQNANESVDYVQPNFVNSEESPAGKEQNIYEFRA